MWVVPWKATEQLEVKHVFAGWGGSWTAIWLQNAYIAVYFYMQLGGFAVPQARQQKKQTNKEKYV